MVTKALRFDVFQSIVEFTPGDTRPRESAWVEETIWRRNGARALSCQSTSPSFRAMIPMRSLSLWKRFMSASTCTGSPFGSGGSELAEPGCSGRTDLWLWGADAPRRKYNPGATPRKRANRTLARKRRRKSPRSNPSTRHGSRAARDPGNSCERKRVPRQSCIPVNRSPAERHLVPQSCESTARAGTRVPGLPAWRRTILAIGASASMSAAIPAGAEHTGTRGSTRLLSVAGGPISCASLAGST